MYMSVCVHICVHVCKCVCMCVHVYKCLSVRLCFSVCVPCTCPGMLEAVRLSGWLAWEQSNHA